MKSLEELKNTTHLLIKGTGDDGGYGIIEFSEKLTGSVIWSNGGGWEHVSFAPFNHRIIPSWETMCRIKDMFFKDDEVCVEYHPSKSEYVNNMPNCLHIWRPINEKLPVPPSAMVGIKKGQTTEELKRELDKII